MWALYVKWATNQMAREGRTLKGDVNERLLAFT